MMSNLPFDRLYYYGRDRPIHVSHSRAPEKRAFHMVPTSNGRRIPRPFQQEAKTL
jgi:hypothetical protein